MSRNRKSQSAAIRFGPALKAFVLCVLIGGSGVGYVWQKDQIGHLGQQIKSREIHLTELEDHNDKLRRQLSTMCSPSSLELRIQELKLGLVPPQPPQILRLPEPAFETPKLPTETQYASKDPNSFEIP
jgi:hypothetical protein